MKIIDHIDPLLVKHNTHFPVLSNPTNPDCGGAWTGHEFFAALWACKPYLQARFEAHERGETVIPGFSSPSWRSRISNATVRKLLPSNSSDRGWLLVAAAHEGDVNYGKQAGIPALSQWVASRRLETVAFLLQAGLNPDGPLVKSYLKDLCRSSSSTRSSFSRNKPAIAVEMETCGIQFR